jgi:putative SOS response-associated peptidase YedK
MCGRIVLKAPARQIAQEFDLATVAAELAPRYNIAPTQPVSAVLIGADGRHALRSLRWGLIPSWSHNPRDGAPLFNARSETVAQKPAFREAFAARRCLVPIDGFYEWRRHDRDRQPFYFAAADGRLLALAGVWSRWQDPDGEVIESCSVLTTTANALVSPVHHRMPVIIPLDERQRWLTTPAAEAAHLAPLLTPAPADLLRMHAVAPAVNRAGHDGPELIAPVEPPPPRQPGLFG